MPDDLQPRLTADAIASFRSALRGEVLEPSTPGYDAVRVVWNGMIDGGRPSSHAAAMPASGDGGALRARSTPCRSPSGAAAITWQVTPCVRRA